jgi:hypothetical protein
LDPKVTGLPFVGTPNNLAIFQSRNHLQYLHPLLDPKFILKLFVAMVLVPLNSLNVCTTCAVV